MDLPVLTAVAGAWEAPVVGALERSRSGVAVVRRCVDLAELLAAAATGQARAVLLSADLRRLDREALARLELAGLAVVGMAPADDAGQVSRLRALGVEHVVPADAPAVVAAVRDLEERLATGRAGTADPARALAPAPGLDDPGEAAAPPGRGGRVVAVWGPTGAPGGRRSRSPWPPSWPRCPGPTLMAPPSPRPSACSTRPRAWPPRAGRRPQAPWTRCCWPGWLPWSRSTCGC